MKNSRRKQQNMKAVIYARQSSGDETDAASVEQQIVNCRKLAVEMDLEIIGTYQDLNISGKTYPDTPEATALAAVDEEYKRWVRSTYDKSQRYRQGLAEALGVLKDAEYLLLDDFTRLMRPLPSSYLESHIVQQFKSGGIKIHCVKDGKINLSSFTDNLVTTIISQINANQIEIQRAKSIEALRKRKDEGYRATGSNLRGYRFVKYQTYELVPEEAAIIRRAYELGLQYLPYQQICRMLSEEFGYAKLSYKFIQDIYRRPEYAGYQYNSTGELIPSICFKDIPIITLAEFRQMQERVRNKRVINRDRKEIYAFSGLCYCGYCGGRMQIASTDPFPASKENHRLHSFACIRNVLSHDNRHNCGKARTRYQYYKNTFANAEPTKRKAVTEVELKSVYTPKKFQNLGMFESLMPLVALPLINDRKQLMLARNIQEKIQELETLKQKRQEHEKELSNMLFRGAIDNAQFAAMAADSRTELAKISQQLIDLRSQASVDRTEEEEKISVLLYLLRLKRIDKHLYKKYVQGTIERINLFAYYLEIEFRNGKKLKLERIPSSSARVLPDWSLQVKNNKAHIMEIYHDSTMRIVTIGTNPTAGAYMIKKSPNSKRAVAAKEKMADL